MFFGELLGLLKTFPVSTSPVLVVEKNSAHLHICQKWQHNNHETCQVGHDMTLETGGFCNL